jgi:outer membrane protein
MNMSQRIKARLLLAGAVLCFAPAAQAETLREALWKAYTSNPTLTGARAGQRAIDETLPLTRAYALPNVNATGNYTENLRSGTTSLSSPDRYMTGRVSVSMPIDISGAVRYGIKGVKARVEAGRANLRGTEADVFGAVVGAYMDVIRDQAIVDLNRTQVRVLGVNLEATRDRFEVGDLTRTDVAQSEARLALANAQLQQAEARLIASKENYLQVVGSAPANLEAPPPLPNLPTGPDSAVEIALQNNPDLIAASKARDAARYDVSIARAARLPRVSAVADTAYTDYLNSLPNTVPGSTRASTAGVQVTFPLFQGGGMSAQVRQAQARQGQAIEQQIAVERGVIAATRAAFASWKASNEVIKSADMAVKANALALEGVRAENSVGSRSILDILDAERELLDSQVQLVTAERNAYVAGFQLLSAMGQAEARDLGLDGGALYDPTQNYRRVKGIFWDWDQDPKPKPQATRTVDSKPQTSDIPGSPVN